jgi:hypothetical protein
MKPHSDAAWAIASRYSDVLASDTRSLAADIDEALRVERERCANVALSVDSGRGNEKLIADAILRR